MEPCVEVQVTAPYSVMQPCHVLSEVVTLWSVFDPLWKTLYFFGVIHEKGTAVDHGLAAGGAACI